VVRLHLGEKFMVDAPRMILALAVERQDDEFIWNRIRTLEAEIFSAPVVVKFAYFGAEGAGQTRRPCIATRWVADTDDWRDIVDHGRANCVCGCYAYTNDILEQALRETRQAPVQAVVIVGDSFHGDLDAAVAIAKKLRAARTRVFLFQQGRSHPTERAFRALAEATGGAYYQFNPHVERVAQRLPEMLEAVSHFALGGMTALEARGNESAALLLEQMHAADHALASGRSTRR
jgi:hypothetical protein